MSNLIYVTGSSYKASFLTQFLNVTFERVDMDLDEIQSLDLREVVEHKVLQAYKMIKKPVIVEDTALEFYALGRLPGPFIKFFCQELSNEQLCEMINGKDRSATARCMFGYYDGKTLKIIEGQLGGMIANKPDGNGGFGWDKIFIADGNSKTNASLSDEAYKEMYLSLKPIQALKNFLEA